MREILFRGKRIEDGEWLYGNYITIYDTPRFKAIESERGMYEVDPATVGQYTGLTDKNGVKIFEGDVTREIFRWNRRNYADDYIIGFDHGSFCFMNFGNIKRSLKGVKEESLEVIGNIHDNPELLKEKIP